MHLDWIVYRNTRPMTYTWFYLCQDTTHYVETSRHW